jgi:hypothetical protein
MNVQRNHQKPYIFHSSKCLLKECVWWGNIGCSGFTGTNDQKLHFLTPIPCTQLGSGTLHAVSTNRSIFTTQSVLVVRISLEKMMEKSKIDQLGRQDQSGQQRELELRNARICNENHDSDQY